MIWLIPLWWRAFLLPSWPTVFLCIFIWHSIKCVFMSASNIFMRRCKSSFNERNSCILIRLPTHLHRCNAQSDMSIFYRAKQLHTFIFFFYYLCLFFPPVNPITAAAAPVQFPTEIQLRFPLSVVSHLSSFVKLVCHLQETRNKWGERRSESWGDLRGLDWSGFIDLNYRFLIVSSHRWGEGVRRKKWHPLPRPQKKICCFRRRGELSSQSGFVINRHGNTVNGHITAAVSWEASSHTATRGWRGFGGLRVEEN